MRYLSIDVETTGLNVLQHPVIEIGIVADAWDRSALDRPDDPYCFHAYVTYSYDPWAGADPVALEMHKQSGLYEAWHRAPRAKLGHGLLTSSVRNVSVPASQLALAVRTWLQIIGFIGSEEMAPRVNVAGKNISQFDWPRLALVPGWEDTIVARRRMMDPGLLYLRPREDETVPDLATCVERAKLPVQVAHHALDDALQVMRLLRHHFKLPYGA